LNRLEGWHRLAREQRNRSVNRPLRGAVEVISHVEAPT